MDTSGYLIKKTYTELLFENKKRKYNDVVMNTTKSMGTPGKRRKIQKNKVDAVGECCVSPVIVQRESKMKSEIIPGKFLKRKDEEHKGIAKMVEQSSKVEELAKVSSKILKVREIVIIVKYIYYILGAFCVR